MGACILWKEGLRCQSCPSHDVSTVKRECSAVELVFYAAGASDSFKL